MREINHKKGLTLVEVVIASTILCVLSTFVLQSMAEHHKKLSESKGVTEHAFSTGRVVEHDMQDIKDHLNGVLPDLPTPTPSTIPMFNNNDQRHVVYYPVTHRIPLVRPPENHPDGLSNKTIQCVVADERPPEFEVPKITRAEAFITLNEPTNVVDAVYAAQSADSSIYIRTSWEVDKPHLLQTMLYRWYVTDSSFPMRWYDGMAYDDPLVGRSKPGVIEDFEIIPHQNFQRLQVNMSRAGQHIICLMTPASYDGKMGRSVHTMPIYIYGLPIIENLVAHYDASVNEDFVEISENRFAQKWRDISSVISNTNADASVSGQYPRLLVTDFSSTVSGQQVDFSDRGSMQLNQFNLNPPFTMFAVVRTKNPVGPSRRMIISRGTSWGFNGADFGLIVGEWTIIGFDSNGRRSVGKYPTPLANVSPSQVAGNPTIWIGRSGSDTSNIDIGELIIYNAIMDWDDWEEVTRYLGEKYNIG